MQKNIRIYLASPFFNKNEIKIVSDIEFELQTNQIEFYSPRSEGILQKMAPAERMACKGNIFNHNTKQLDWATHIVAVLDTYDTGTIWEMGYAYKAGKKIITYNSNFRRINIMLSESVESHCTYIHDIPSALLDENFISKEPEDLT